MTALARGDEDQPALTIVRHLAAPRALVFRCWAEPDHLRAWCRPKNFTVLDGGMDFRPGGAWHSAFRSPDGTDYRMRGIYQEIVPDRRIVFTHTWIDAEGMPGHETVITVTFEDEADGRTRLTFHQAVFATVSARDSHAEGWGEALDYLERHVAAQGMGPITTLVQ